jgi:carboxypeptidase PM20D1
MIKRLLQVLLFLLLLLIAAVAVNTLRHGSRQLEVKPVAPMQLDADAAAQRLAGALRFKTVSSQEEPELNADQFDGLHAYLAQAYPKLHAALKKETISGHSLLYTWQGSDAKAKPILLMAHQDVVPISPGTEGKWEQQPFAGVVQGGYIWGRGSWDDKGNLLAMMEAVEHLLAEGYQPRQTIYFAFGQDEEVSGLRGAKQIAALLKSRGVQLDFVLDEGLLVTEGILKGLDKPAALIGVAEKGYASFTLAVDATAGHSSMPTPQTAIGMMSAALTKLEQNQLPGNIRGVALDMFETIAPEMSGANRVLLSNLWLFGPLVQHELAKGTGTNAMLRTTTALTVFNAGNKDNVLPGHAEATVNFRLLPGDTQASVAEHIKQVAANEAIKVTPFPSNAEASRVTPVDSKPYQLMNRTIRETFSGTIVAPGLMLGATDSRHFEGISEHIFKFTPVRAGPDDLSRFHGTNERISVKNYAEMIGFYRQLLKNAALP